MMTERLAAGVDAAGADVVDVVGRTSVEPVAAKGGSVFIGAVVSADAASVLSLEPVGAEIAAELSDESAMMA